LADGSQKDIAHFTYKKPKWSKKSQSFALNFNGRVSRGSMKNFQLVDEYDDSKIYLQFGKVEKDIFHMDFAFPFSFVQAFAICLTAFEWHLNK